jgi:hypothetical protein
MRVLTAACAHQGCGARGLFWFGLALVPCIVSVLPTQKIGAPKVHYGPVLSDRCTTCTYENALFIRRNKSVHSSIWNVECNTFNMKDDPVINSLNCSVLLISSLSLSLTEAWSQLRLIQTPFYSQTPPPPLSLPHISLLPANPEFSRQDIRIVSGLNTFVEFPEAHRCNHM